MAAMVSAGAHSDNFDEFTLGYERLLPSNGRFTVRGLYRHLRTGLLVSGAIGNPGPGGFDWLPAPQRDYIGLEIASEGAWRGIRYRASYVLSRTRGNYTGLFSSDYGTSEGARTPGVNLGLTNAEQARNSFGLLPNDRTHVFKVSAAHTFGSGLDGGVFLSGESGSPINELAAGAWDNLWNTVYLVPRGSAGRTPFLWNVDLRLAYPLGFGRGSGSRVVLDLLHVGNPRGTTWVEEVHYLTRDANGNPATPNPRYGLPVAFQPPMGARVGVEIGL